MQINVYAILKEFFPARFEVNHAIADIAGLKEFLQQQHPAAAELLGICRFAVGDAMVTSAYSLKASDIVFVLPPGSGG